MIPILRLLRAAAGSDQDLLDRYVRNRDDEAFEALVQRYGNGVWAACLRLVGRDAEDAFQAVFLTLSRKAGTVTGSLPAWLHAVTRRVASTLRRTSLRRISLEAVVARPDLAPDVTHQEGILDEELSRLPERYRAVLIVCCLEGRSRDEAAIQLGWSEGQVKGRLERARELLRIRLARRNVELGVVLLATTVTAHVRANIPSAASLSLTHGVIRAMMIQKFKLAAVLLTTCVGVAIAGGMVLHPGDPLPDVTKSQPSVSKEPQDASAKKIRDLQKERIDTLKQVVDVLKKRFQSGEASYEEPLEAQMLLLTAELDAAQKESDRIEIYKKSLDALNAYEAMAKARKEAARGTMVDVLRVKARRLEVEILLEQAKLKEAKESK